MTVEGRSFLDSNILVYTDDHDSPKKQAVALELVESCLDAQNGVVSTQVLQEYYSATTRKLKVLPEAAKEKVEVFSDLNLFRIEIEDILAAIDLHQAHRIAFWDGLIVRAALESGCSVLYSEDLQAGRKIEGLEIVNPFL